MDITADVSTLPVDFEGSLDPSRLPEITLGNHTMMSSSGQTSPLMSRAGGDRLSPVRGRTMKEYDQQISDLKKENFSLKMRIYYMEERMQQRFGDGQDVFKTNIELQVEIDNLKRELTDKQVLVQKAALAMETLTAKYEQGEEAIRNRLLADYKMDMIQMRDQLDKANQKCERSYQDVEDAERKLQVLKQQLDDARTELADSRRTNEELSSKVNSAEFGAQTLTGQLKLAEQAKEKMEKENQQLTQRLKDLDDQLQDVCKQSGRKDRDILNLSTILQDQSHVDCTSILEPVHIQDELEDQRAALAKKDGHIGDLEGKLNDRDDTIEDLKNALQDLEDKQKEVEKALEAAENELERKNMQINRYKKSVEGLVKSVYLKEKESKDLKIKLEEIEKEVKQLHESLREMEKHKTKELNNLTSQLAEADANIRRLNHQLTEANETSENLVKSLGKKEGELAGFQEQLGKAMDALNKSEEAVESLQAQLKAERAEFEDRLRQQAVHFQISVSNKSESNNELEGLRQQIVDLQKLIASQNVELLGLARERHALGDVHDRLKEKDSDIELLSSEHKRELSELEQELRALRCVINNKDIKIQALEDHKVWLEDNHRETVQRMRETWSSVGEINVRDLSLDLLQDIKMLMDLLRREISSLATLQLQLRELDKSEHGVDTEVLMTEITSVQRIYKQLEEGVEKNGRLHQVLLNSLRGEQRLSDSPDSNSCQDGGYNLESTHPQAKHTKLSTSPDMKQSDLKTAQKFLKTGVPAVQSESLCYLDSEWESRPGCHSVAVETCPELIDRSLQTGTSFTHIDQWVQTSPRTGEGAAEDGLMGKRGLDIGLQMHEAMLVPHGSGTINNRKFPLVDCDDDVRLYILGHHNDSLTDDAKEEHLGLCTETLEDYHNFQHGVFFDERRIDSHSDESSPKCDPSRLSSPGGRILIVPANATSKAGYRISSGSNNGDIVNIDLIRNCDKFPNSLLTHLVNGNTSDADEPDGSASMPASSTNLGRVSANNSGSTYISHKHSEQMKNSSLDNQLTKTGNSVQNSLLENGRADLSSDISLSKSTTELLKVGEAGEHKENTKVYCGDIHASENAKKEEGFVEKESNDLDESSEKRVRSNSWAEELEQYRVPDTGLSLNVAECSQSSENNLQDQDSISRILQTSLDYSPQNIGIMSPSELRSLVAEMQKSLMSATSLNKKLQKQLDAANIVLDEQMRGDHEAGVDLCVKDDPKSNVLARVQNRRSHIPRPLTSSSAANISSGSTADKNTNNTESVFGISSRSVDHQLGESTTRHLGNFGHPEIDTTKTSTGDKTVDKSNNFTESYNQVRKLEERLLASEQSVRLLSKKNETYLSALEAVGSLAQLSESDGESCFMSTWASSQYNGHENIQNLNASSKDTNSSNVASGASSSMERNRSHFPITFSQSRNDSCPSPLTETLSATPSVSADSTTRDTESDAGTLTRSTELQDKNSSDVKHPDLQVCLNILSKTNDPIGSDQSTSHNLTNTDNSWPMNIHHGAKVSPHQNKTSEQPRNQSYSLNSTNQFNNMYQDSEGWKSPRKSGNLHPNHAKLPMDASVLDQSGYPDVTYSSMLDSTVMNRLLTNLDNNMSTIREDALNTSILSLEQLQIRVEHLERVNLTLREEIGVYEALHRSQSTQVSPYLGDEFGRELNGQGGGMTEDDLLKQHLIEIRKLRQRLERLDITKDPEQLLIFQSHTQQRIVRQEIMISHLQQQLVEKEEQWQRTLSEMQHRLSREKALLVEKLEATICELQKEIRSQRSTIEDQERHIIDLDSELNLKEQYETQKDDELKKIVCEKSELEADLLKRDKEFLDIEKNLFKLEMANENNQSECKRLCIEMEEKDKENEKLRKQVDESKENSRSLKETVVKCEKSIQEKVFTVQKLTSERVISDHRLAERDGHVKKLEAEIVIFKKEIYSLRSELEEKEGLKTEIDLLREEVKKKDSLKTKYEFQKVGYEAEIDRITEEKSKMASQLESKNKERTELKHKIDEFEQKLLGKAALENQIYSLKEEIKSLSRLQDKVDNLKFELDSKMTVEEELRNKLKTMNHLQSEVDALRDKLFRADDSVRQAEDGKKKVIIDLKEKEEKLKKRDKQLNHLLGQYKKLDTAFTRQKYTLNEKLELVQSLKKQMHLYEVTLTCASQEEKDSIMKQLLRELIATQRQVEELLSRLEQNSAALKAPVVFLDGFNVTSSTTITTTTNTSNHHDHPNVTGSSAVRDDFPEVDIDQAEQLFDELNQGPSDLDQDHRSHCALAPISTNHLSPHRSHLSSHSTSPGHSSRKQKYFSDSSYAMPKGNIPQGIHNLFAVLKLESHEKLRKETGECLVTLSGMEARLGSRLRMYKSKSVSERIRSLDYSTLRETSMSCQNLRVCLEEVSRLLTTAWVTELPPIDNQGHFYDPVLAEQNENLKLQLMQLSTRYDMLDPCLKEQQGRGLNTTSENNRLWESSLYKQLHKTTKDLEQAKENINTSLAELPSPRRYQSFNNYSPHKSPRRRLEDTL